MTRSACFMSSAIESLNRKTSSFSSWQLSASGKKDPLPICRSKRLYPRAFNAYEERTDSLFLEIAKDSVFEFGLWADDAPSDALSSCWFVRLTCSQWKSAQLMSNSCLSDICSSYSLQGTAALQRAPVTSWQSALNMTLKKASQGFHVATVTGLLIEATLGSHFLSSQISSNPNISMIWDVSSRTFYVSAEEKEKKVSR